VALTAPSADTSTDTLPSPAGTVPQAGGLSPSPVAVAMTKSELAFRGLPGAGEANVFPLLCG